MYHEDRERAAGVAILAVGLMFLYVLGSYWGLPVIFAGFYLVFSEG